jgi:tetratricopeptide (TPR) repeat protein
MGYTKEAIADLDKSIEINPKSGVSFYNRGIALNKVGEKQAAIADLEEAAILYKNNGEMQSYQQALRELDNIQKSQ